MLSKAGESKPIPDNEILTLSNSKAFADNKLNVTQSIKFVFHSVENIVGKGQNTFCPFPTMFKMFLEASKVIIVW